MLGEAALGPEIDWAGLNYTEVFITVLARILEEWQLSAADVDDLFSEAREMAAGVRDIAGDVNALEAGPLVAGGFQVLYQGHNDDALAAFDRAAALKPDGYWVSFGRAETLSCLERYAEELPSAEERTDPALRSGCAQPH